MARRLMVSLNYGTHLPALMQAVRRMSGPVLELGVGLFSTPYLHYACQLQGQQLVSYDNDPGWAKIFSEKYDHEIIVIGDWADALIDKQTWGVALVDHSPDFRRAIEIERLAPLTRYIVCHDANGRYHKQYGYDRVFPLFAHQTVYDKANPHTAVLSNFIDLTDFWSPV